MRDDRSDSGHTDERRRPKPIRKARPARSKSQATWSALAEWFRTVTKFGRGRAGTKPKKGRSGANHGRKPKATARRRTHRKMTRAIQQRRAARGQNRRTGRR